jgi:hypothetical protein
VRLPSPSMPGRFGAVSTGEEVLQGVNLAGRVAVVTGESKVSSGIPCVCIFHVQLASASR